MNTKTYRYTNQDTQTPYGNFLIKFYGKMLKAYNERKIIECKLNEFATDKDISVSLDKVDVKDGKLNIDCAFKVSENKLTDKTKFKFGLAVFDKNNIYVLDINSYINSVVEENKSIFSNGETSNVYYNECVKEVFGEMKNLELPRVEKLFEDVVLEDGTCKISYSFPIKGNVNVEDLEVRVNEVMFFETEGDTIKTVVYNPFTEWQFNI